ncbi:MAG: Gfo/Idh/MocA family oxidoreductase [Actinomycetia bacterium]|nr:Gfo/Idh/MocA family oxidoreductase [Actinomycetes bacterium]
MTKIKCGIIGMGYISGYHIDAIRRAGFLEVSAITDINYELAKKKADEYCIPKCYRSVDELLTDPEITAVHNCTPNNLHFEINEKIIKSGKHVFSEKPLAMDSRESMELLELLKKNPKVAAGVNFLYRMNPLVQEMKAKVRSGDIGRPLLVHGSYLQDWLLYDTDYNWRVEKKFGGVSRCIADIGSHWMDAVQKVLDDRIVEVCSDLVIAHNIRKKPTKQVETFAEAGDIKYEDRNVDTEDYGAVLFKMQSGVHGVFYVSEVSAGRKCYFNFEIDGTKSSMYWNQETADWMWIGYKDKYNHQVMRNPNLMTDEASHYTDLAAGHPEGWNDAQKNNIYSFYKFIADGKKPETDLCDFATFDEAHYIIKITEAILESSKTRSWVKV